jgi:hypothetical protein
MESGYGLAMDPALTALMAEHQDSSRATLFPRELKVWVDPVKGLFSAWYEIFPRSHFTEPVQTDGTLLGLEKLLPEIARMGFDVVYLPPSIPSARPTVKGGTTPLGPSPGNREAPGPSVRRTVDTRPCTLGWGPSRISAIWSRSPRSTDWMWPWTSRSNALRTIPGSFDHPEWFRHRADGSIRFAENPPKKYEDVYPINFEMRKLAGALGRAALRLSLLGRSGRALFPRGQPAHQAHAVLGMVHHRGQGAPSGNHFPFRGLHQAQGHVQAGQGRIFAVLYLFHLAQHQGRAH